MYLFTNPVVLGIRNFAVLQPPLFVFTTCLVTFGVVMLSIANNLHLRDVPNPDIDLDWNIFLNRLSDLHYCILPEPSSLRLPQSPYKRTGNSTMSPDQPKVQVVDQLKSLAALLPDIGSTDDMKSSNVTIAVAVDHVKFHRSVLSQPVSWHAVARGDMVGARGARGREKFLLAMLMWPKEVSPEMISECPDCRVDATMCLIIQGPSQLMPKTKQPPRCYLNAIPPQVSREVRLQRTAADKEESCPNGVWTSFQYSPNPDLTPMLTPQDLLLVQQRLLKCGFLLLAISTLIIFSTAFCAVQSPQRRFAKLSSCEA